MLSRLLRLAPRYRSDGARSPELDGLLLGVARAEPYAETERLIAERRARGLFGDLRFTLTNTPRSCHPERLVRGARSVIAAALPLWRPARRGPHGPGRPHAALRLERPLRAAARAPHGARRPSPRARRALRGVRRLQPPRRPRCRRARPGSRSRRATRWRSCPGEGSFVALGAIVTDAELEPAEELVPPGCGSCTLCLDACPTGALIEPGVLDATRCLSTTTQRARADAGRARRTRSRIASTAATSARTCAPGTPARPRRRADLPERSGRLGVARRLARAARRASCSRVMRTSTCPSATRATCGATRSSRSATRRPDGRELALPYADDPDPLLRDAARRGRSHADERADPVALGAREHGAAEDDVVRADAEVRDDDLPCGPRGRIVGEPASDRAVELAPAAEVRAAVAVELGRRRRPAGAPRRWRSRP